MGDGVGGGCCERENDDRQGAEDCECDERLSFHIHVEGRPPSSAQPRVSAAIPRWADEGVRPSKHVDLIFNFQFAFEDKR